MAQEAPVKTNEAPKKSISACWIAAIVVFIIFVMIISGYFGLAWILRTIDKKAGTSESEQAKSEVADKQIIGEWESDCLVPDLNSPWSEQHHFTLRSDSTATHIRWSSDGHQCAKEQTITTNYTYLIPEINKIDLAFVSETREPEEFQEMAEALQSGTGGTMYDIYQISGNTLLFGHGFRDDFPYSTAYGSSESGRLDSLNQYIVYKKK